jgi:hypothetical protein
MSVSRVPRPEVLQMLLLCFGSRLINRYTTSIEREYSARLRWNWMKRWLDLKPATGLCGRSTLRPGLSETEVS